MKWLSNVDLVRLVKDIRGVKVVCQRDDPPPPPIENDGSRLSFAPPPFMEIIEKGGKI